jgi:hypothetical protein
VLCAPSSWFPAGVLSEEFGFFAAALDRMLTDLSVYYQDTDVDLLIEHLFYAILVLHVFWFFEDKTNPKKASNLFTLVNSLPTAILSTIYVIKKDVWYSTVSHSWFLSGMIMEMAYGYIYYPEQMVFATTTMHHTAYLFTEWYLVRTGLAAPFSVYFPQEFPTFILQVKRYWFIENNFWLETIFGFLFFFLRWLFYFYVSWSLRHEILNDYFYMFAFSGVTFMHVTWLYSWFVKYIKKINNKEFWSNEKGGKSQKSL